MKNLFALLVFTLSTSVFADGFKCEQQAHGLKIKVFNSTHAAEGTRNAAIMIFSDENVSFGRKTIASFSSSKRTLGQSGASYLAVVDLRVSESNRSGENILGTKLGMIKEIFVDVYHNYSLPLANGEETEGKLTLVKRNGDSIDFDLTCSRYLKH